MSRFWIFCCCILVLVCVEGQSPFYAKKNPPNEQCACATNSCPSYDRQVLATDLVEAVRNFPDLTLPDPPDPTEYEGEGNKAVTGSYPLRGLQYHCKGPRCRDCSREIVDRIYDAGFFGDDAERMKAEARLGIAAHKKEHECGRMQMQRGYNPHEGKGRRGGGGGRGPSGGGVRGRGSGSSEVSRGGNWGSNWGGKGGNNRWATRGAGGSNHGGSRTSFSGGGPGGGRTGGFGGSGGGGPPQGGGFGGGGGPPPGGSGGGGFGGGPGGGGGGPPRGRKKRQTLNSVEGTENIGTRRTLFCIKIGNPIEKNSAFLAICDYCWAWRELPAEYSPKYLNELICDTDGDSSCLTQHGSCQQIYRNVDVMKTVGTEQVQQTIRVGTSCNCHIKPDSQAFNLVTGKGFT